jgi:hypothetical protein
MQAHGHVNLPVMNMFVGGFTKLAAIFILTGNPNIGIIGTPIGSILCYVTITVLNIITIRKVLPQPPAIVKNMLRSFLAAAIMGVCAYGAWLGLKAIGISNGLNTGCPTMWGLTAEHCAAIPTQKASHVICTLTDYNRDPQNDRAMLDILLANYRTVHLWLQGRDDLSYVQELGYENKLHLISGTLAEFDAVLAQKDLDYVGTRLHAGIRALSKGHRSLIISIDNRAECIGADTGLPILPREDIPSALQARLRGQIETVIRMPWETIAKWKAQFR